MQRTYRFIEFDVTTAGVERTGRVLDFDASNRAGAIAALLYTLRQSSGSTPWEVGETGRSVLVRRAPVGSKGYALEYDVDEVKAYNREGRACIGCGGFVPWNQGSDYCESCIRADRP